MGAPDSWDEEGRNAVQQVASLEEYLDHDPIHLAFSGGCEEMDQLEEILKSELGSSVKILGTKYLEQDFTLLDIVNPAASKGAGVAAAQRNWARIAKRSWPSETITTISKCCSSPARAW